MRWYPPQQMAEPKVSLVIVIPRPVYSSRNPSSPCCLKVWVMMETDPKVEVLEVWHWILANQMGVQMRAETAPVMNPEAIKLEGFLQLFDSTQPMLEKKSQKSSKLKNSKALMVPIIKQMEEAPLQNPEAPISWQMWDQDGSLELIWYWTLRQSKGCPTVTNVQAAKYPEMMSTILCLFPPWRTPPEITFCSICHSSTVRIKIGVGLPQINIPLSISS